MNELLETVSWRCDFELRLCDTGVQASQKSAHVSVGPLEAWDKREAVYSAAK